MTVTVDDLAKHLGFAVTPADTEALDRALANARAIVTPYLIVDAFAPDQAQVLDQAILIVGKDIYIRKDATGGTISFADGTEGTAILPRNPIKSVLPMLSEAGLAEPAAFA